MSVGAHLRRSGCQTVFQSRRNPGRMPPEQTAGTASATLDDVLRMDARAGRFLVKKGDGEPGAKIISEGLGTVRFSARRLKTPRKIGLMSSCV